MLFLMARRGSLRLTLILAALIVFIVLPSTVDFLMSWLWFGSVGYRNVFLTGLRAQASLWTVVFAIAFFVLFGNLWIAVFSIGSPYSVLGKVSCQLQVRMGGRDRLGSL